MTNPAEEERPARREKKFEVVKPEVLTPEQQKALERKERARKKQLEKDQDIVYGEITAAGGTWADYAVGERMTSLYSLIMEKEEAARTTSIEHEFGHMRNWKEINQLFLSFVASYKKALRASNEEASRKVLKIVAGRLAKLVNEMPGLTEERRGELTSRITKQITDTARELQAPAELDEDEGDVIEGEEGDVIESGFDE